MNSLKAAVLFIVVSLGTVVFSFAAPVPQIIQYQGTLSDKNGAPSNGSFNMTFSVYSSATGSAPVWTEKMSSTNVPANPVIVTNGAFNVMLGALNPLDPGLFTNNSKTYLGVKVGTDSEMVPRQRIASVGYAFAAGNGIPKGGIIMWSGAVNQIPDGWALCDGSFGTPDLRDRFIVGAGGAYTQGQTGGETNHTLTVAEMPSHTHLQNPHTHIQNPHNHVNGVYSKLLKYTGGETTADTDSTSGEPNLKSYGDMLAATGTNQNTTATSQNSGSGQPHNNLPPYYALAFIVKL